VVERGDAPVALDERTRLQDRFDAHCETLRIHWSSATATMISTPIANSCQSTSSPASDTAERKTADDQGADQRADDGAAPPNRLVPPITTAVMLSRLAFSPAVGLIAPMRPDQRPAGDRGDGAGQGVDAEQNAVGVDAGQPRRFGIVAGLRRHGGHRRCG